MKKNDIIELKITDMSVDGEGVGRYEDIAFFVKDALAGDKVRAVITKLKKGYGYARLCEVITPSEDRIEPACPNAAKCGGCQIMQLDYKAQLKLKENKVKNDLVRIGKQRGINTEPIIGMDEKELLHFRNKVQFPVGISKDGTVVTGFYAGRTHCIIETHSCPVSAPEADDLIGTVRRFIEENHISVYDEASGKGLVRHVLIRTGFSTGQIMVCLVINGETLGKNKRTGEDLDEAFACALKSSGYGSRISCIGLNINKENTNVILGRQMVFLAGNRYIEDNIGDIRFRISPLSFFQVNSRQTEKLYSKALEYADLTGSETVWDLYCGIGTISLFLARKAKRVFGVEIVPDAVSNARENAHLNGITNAQFFCGSSEEIFPKMCKEPGFCADVVVVDPPRKGCGAALLAAILEVGPDRVVYVSCNSSTLARDIAILSERYSLEAAAPVDMFPHTVHVECCVLLSKLHSEHHIEVTVDMDELDVTKAEDHNVPQCPLEKVAAINKKY